MSIIEKLPEFEEIKGTSGFVTIEEGIMLGIVAKINEIIEELNKLKQKEDIGMGNYINNSNTSSYEIPDSES